MAMTLEQILKQVTENKDRLHYEKIESILNELYEEQKLSYPVLKTIIDYISIIEIINNEFLKFDDANLDISKMRKLVKIVLEEGEK